MIQGLIEIIFKVKHCLAIAAGDIERATQILIDRQENGQCLSQNSTLTIQVAKQTIDDAELKSRIIERYSYIDKDTLNKVCKKNNFVNKSV